MSATPVDTDRLYGTSDAAVWAEEFAKVHPEIDRGLMISWFANAIETAKDIDRRENPQRGPLKDRDFAVLSRDALVQFFGEMALPPWRDADGSLIGTGVDCAPIASRITDWLDEHDLGDLYMAIGSGAS